MSKTAEMFDEDLNRLVDIPNQHNFCFNAVKLYVRLSDLRANDIAIVNGTELCRNVSEKNYLGVIIDSNLKFTLNLSSEKLTQNLN